jgi:hypothetical protein
MFIIAAANAGHPAVAALLGIAAAGLAGAVVAMAWNVHVRQIRLAELLARRQLIVTGTAGGGPDGGDAPEAATPGGQRVTPGGQRVNGGTPAPAVVIEGPETVVAGEQARYRVRPAGNFKVVSWAVGGGAVSQAPDPAHPGDLLLVADRPGSLTIIVRVRDGMTERRGTKPITAVPDLTPTPPVTLRLFLHGWGLVTVTVLVTGLAAALDALGNLSSSGFIALAVPLAALLAVVAAARGTADTPSRRVSGTALPSAHDGWPAEPPAPGRPQPAEAPAHNQRLA